MTPHFEQPAARTPPPGARSPYNNTEDESADPVGDGHSDADLAEQLPPAPPEQSKPPAKKRTAHNGDSRLTGVTAW